MMERGADIGGGATAADLVKALNHETRRSILRILLATAPASATQIRNGISGYVGNRLTFHLGILVTTGAVTRGQKRAGRRELYYSPSQATRVPWFLTVLQLTAPED